MFQADDVLGFVSKSFNNYMGINNRTLEVYEHITDPSSGAVVAP